MHPSSAFSLILADAAVLCRDLARNAPVFFLLDDVSTRHLDEVSIRDLVSQLLFSSESCAFKIATETQTLELVLRSPGMKSSLLEAQTGLRAMRSWR